MRTSFFTILLLMIHIMTIKADYPLFFLGHVYTENAHTGKPEMIPFATVKLYELNNPEKLLLTRFSELNGTYTIEDIDTQIVYILEVIAPGYKKQKFLTRGKSTVKSGNINISTCLEKENEDDTQISKRSYTLKELAGDQKKLSVSQLIEKISGIYVEGDEIYTDHGAVRIIANGRNMVADGYKKMKKMPAAKIVKSVDFYDLPETPDYLYAGVLDIRLTMGEESTPLGMPLECLKKYED